MGTTVAVAGASGYAGGELLRLLAGHPHLEIGEIVGGPSSTGQQLGDVHPQLPMLGDRVLADAATLTETSADLVFLALPHGASAAIAAQLPPGVRVVDLGADHRLVDPTAWERAYGGPHAGSWPYGLPELPGAREQDRRRAPGRGARLLSDRGDPRPSSVARCRTGGIGTTSSWSLPAAPRAPVSRPGRRCWAVKLMGDMSAYKVGPPPASVYEMTQALGLEALSFTPVLVPLPRGMLAT